jgi:hypothetical protein
MPVADGSEQSCRASGAMHAIARRVGLRLWLNPTYGLPWSLNV